MTIKKVVKRIGELTSGGDVFRMDVGSVVHIIHRGGTVLYTVRSEEFKCFMP